MVFKFYNSAVYYISHGLMVTRMYYPLFGECSIP